MRLTLKSIYFQLLASFLFIILVTLTVNTLFEYRTYTSQLPKLVTEIRTKSMAYQLSSAYTIGQNWNSIESDIENLINLEILNTIENAAQRLIIRDIEGKTVFNSFSKITTLESVELIEGESQPIINLNNSEPVGVVTMYISKEYVSHHAKSYAFALLYSGIYKALIIAVVAFILSIILSKYITGPVIRLTGCGAEYG